MRRQREQVQMKSIANESTAICFIFLGRERPNREYCRRRKGRERTSPSFDVFRRPTQKEGTSQGRLVDVFRNLSTSDVFRRPFEGRIVDVLQEFVDVTHGKETVTVFRRLSTSYI